MKCCKSRSIRVFPGAGRPGGPASSSQTPFCAWPSAAALQPVLGATYHLWRAKRHGGPGRLEGRVLPKQESGRQAPSRPLEEVRSPEATLLGDGREDGTFHLPPNIRLN